MITDPCPAYSIGSSSSNMCQFCPGGTVGPHDGNTDEPRRGWLGDQGYVCGACLAGTYQNTTQATEMCSDCQPGLYSSPMSSECSVCGMGTVPSTAAGGASHCITCSVGKHPRKNVCERCERGNIQLSVSAWTAMCVSAMIRARVCHVP